MALHDLDEGGWFNSTQSNPAQKKVSWSASPSINYSDWTIVIRKKERPDRIYHVHKVFLSSGQRASGFFRDQFSQMTTDESATATTVFDESYPISLRRYMSVLLNYFYDLGRRISWDTGLYVDSCFNIQKTKARNNILPMMDLARFLRIPDLGRLCIEQISVLSIWEKRKPEIDIFLLKDGRKLHLEIACCVATARLLTNFKSIKMEFFSRLSVEMLESILKQDKLNSDEDYVFDVIVQYLASVKPNQDDARRLWLCCRLVHLSGEKQVAAFQHSTFPRELFCEDMIASNTLNKGIATNSSMSFSPDCFSRIALRNKGYLLQPAMIGFLKVQCNVITPSNAPIVAFKILPEFGSNTNPAEKFTEKLILPTGWCAVKTTDSDFSLIKSHIIVNLRGVEIYVKSGRCFQSFAGKDGIIPGRECWRGTNNSWASPIYEKKKQEYTINNLRGRILVRACAIESFNNRKPKTYLGRALCKYNKEEGWLDHLPTIARSWRNHHLVNHSDWTIVVRVEGGLNKSFSVHKALLSHGKRASGYFLAQFSSNTLESGKATSVLNICPACIGCIPMLLDYIYDGKLKLKESNVLPLMELARYLIIPDLGQKCAKWVTNVLKIGGGSFAIRILVSAVDLYLEKVRDAATDAVLYDFETIDKDYFLNLSIELLQSILKQDTLISSEDYVFDVIVNYLDYIKPEKNDAKKLWLCCRFVHLSSEKQVAGFKHVTFPQDMFCEDFIALNALNRIDAIDPKMNISPSIQKRVALRNQQYLLRPCMVSNILIDDNMITVTNTTRVKFKLIADTDPDAPFGIPEGWCAVETTDSDFHLIRQYVIANLPVCLIYVENEDSLIIYYGKEGHSPGNTSCYQTTNTPTKQLVRAYAIESCKKRRRM